ncbi:class I SAM-dependent methyltransferase [Neptunomonas sp.]|uniref:class I SAM-dependent methyltransferase n=1 Tax=Neptunomonas sp. TaxID=1971898 RepID=UPI0025DE80F5|nr:class I SAM-dependent methyltransferase [Neptunomonas sp.]
MTSIDSHYSQSLQSEKIISRLNTAYPDGPNLYHLAPIDQLHIGGIKASEKLSQRLIDFKASKVLDIGSGLGGLLRVCKNHYPAFYVGLDITHKLNKINRQLNKLHDKSSPSMIVTGNGQQLPFADQSFDLIILQHSLLNMPDKISALKECQRILIPGGHIILHEVLTGNHHETMQFPVPWARHPALSHLISTRDMNDLVNSTSLTIRSMEDWTAEALSWRNRQTNKQKKPQTPVVSPSMILGSEFTLMGKNVQRNLENDAIRIVEWVLS